jgi:transposase InsO family protein
LQFSLFDDRDCEVEVTLTNVLYVPTCRYNLFSMSAADRKGASLHIQDGAFSVESRGRRWISGHATGSHMYAFMEGGPTAFASEASIDVKLAHQRLGHPSSERLQRSIPLVQGLNVAARPAASSVCDSCIIGKHSRTKFPKQTEHRAKTKFELVHSDVCGPMETESVGGSRYLLTLIDDFSRYTRVYFMKHKSEASTIVKEYVQLVKTQFDVKVKSLRTDGGGEYVNEDLSRFLREKGIRHQKTAPYTPQQNGVAERKNRTIFEAVRTMLHSGRMQKRFWVEAAATAVYLQNRTATTAVDGKTPYEALFDERPNASHLKVFGCDVYVHVPDARRRKLDDKSVACRFLGYGEDVKAYKVYDPATKRIFSTRDVVFKESCFGAYKLEDLSEFNIYEIDDIPKEHEQLRQAPPEKLGEVEERQPDADGAAAAEPQPEPKRSGRERRPTQHYGETVDNWHDFCVGDEVPTYPDRPHSLASYAMLAIDAHEPQTYEQAIRSQESDKWRDAMDYEIAALKKMQTWELTELPSGRRAVGSKWVYKLKRDASGDVFKYRARLVAKGFTQQHGVDYNEVFAPVARFASIRLLLGMANLLNLEVHQMDVQSAFLNGKIEEEIFMKQPPGYVDEAQPNAVCRLQRSLYGLKQSARCWNLELHKYLISNGYTQCTADPCVYVKRDGESFLWLSLYVDDLILACNDTDMLCREKKLLGSGFEMTDQGEIGFILGVLVERDRTKRVMTLSQHAYLQEVLERYGMSDCKQTTTPCDLSATLTKLRIDEEVCRHVQYQSVVGSLLYAALATRPDLAHAVGVLARHVAAPGERHWTAAKRVLRYVRGTVGAKLTFSAELGEQLIGYSDADWAGDHDSRKSTAGYVFLLGGAVSWRSKLEPIVAQSSMEAAYIALNWACQERVWLVRLLQDFKMEEFDGNIVFEDNQGAIAFSRNPSNRPGSKHIEVKWHWIRELVADKKVEIKYCPTAEQLADFFTKAVGRVVFEKNRRGVGVRMLGN